MPVPDVHVAVANAGSLDAQQHLLTLGLGIWVFPRFQRLSPFDDLHRTHPAPSISRKPMIYTSPRLFSLPGRPPAAPSPRRRTSDGLAQGLGHEHTCRSWQGAID